MFSTLLLFCLLWSTGNRVGFIPEIKHQLMPYKTQQRPCLNDNLFVTVCVHDVAEEFAYSALNCDHQAILRLVH